MSPSVVLPAWAHIFFLMWLSIHIERFPNVFSSKFYLFLSLTWFQRTINQDNFHILNSTKTQFSQIQKPAFAHLFGEQFPHCGRSGQQCRRICVFGICPWTTVAGHWSKSFEHFGQTRIGKCLSFRLRRFCSMAGRTHFRHFVRCSGRRRTSLAANASCDFGRQRCSERHQQHFRHATKCGNKWIA